MTLQEIVDREEIRNVLTRYCRGVDRGDRNLIRSAYHEDAWDDHGTFEGPAHAFADVIVERYDASGLIGQHHITNLLVEFNGDRACSECYFVSYNPDGPSVAASGNLRAAGGRYLDVFEKRNGSWKILERKVIIDWVQPDDDGQVWAKLENFERGGRREADPSHMFFQSR